MQQNQKIIISGSRGLIGRTITSALKESGYGIIELDLTLGHDLTDEIFVKDFFIKNHSYGLINLFALNDHVDSERISNKLMDIDLITFDKYLKVNLTALFSVCREFARNNESGSIVNFTSTYGVLSPNPKLYNGDEKNIAYGISKAGVIQLTRHLAVHLAPRIRVNCIMPGGVRHKQNREFQKKYNKLTPMGRMMEAEELVGMVLLLVSKQSSYCSGAVYAVDGGWTAW
ncbi:MAG: SDR family oxidoreductase [Bacteroidales bacterium]|jgi:NAD(P)-dependent dehydrogenase (short-subunit alcohol dehydrogenase family)|nr:SDR family oxidoreductase [Bacteroidales bacterium]